MNKEQFEQWEKNILKCVFFCSFPNIQWIMLIYGIRSETVPFYRTRILFTESAFPDVNKLWVSCCLDDERGFGIPHTNGDSFPEVWWYLQGRTNYNDGKEWKTVTCWNAAEKIAPPPPLHSYVVIYKILCSKIST